MELIEYAKREFLAIGYEPIEKLNHNDSDRWIQEDVLGLLEVMSKQGHSGTSAPYVVGCFAKLALFKPLAPLTGDEAEWTEVSEGIFRNKRCSHVFQEYGVAYDIEGYVFWHWDDDGTEKYKSKFTSNMSRKMVEFPYTPTDPTVIEVESFEVDKETGEKTLGSELWETIYPEEIKKNNEALEAAFAAGREARSEKKV